MTLREQEGNIAAAGRGVNGRGNVGNAYISVARKIAIGYYLSISKGADALPAAMPGPTMENDMAFTTDNTDGYTDDQLAALNAELAAILAAFAPDDIDGRAEAEKAFADEVSRR